MPPPDRQGQDAMQSEEVRGAGSVLLRRGLLLEYTTLGWNVVGTVVVIAAAVQARSVALAGFGLELANRNLCFSYRGLAVKGGVRP